MSSTHERRFQAMGTQCHIIINGPDHLAETAEGRVRDLEQRWSRFLPDSEVSLLNAAAGAWQDVSTETLTLLLRSVRAATDHRPLRRRTSRDRRATRARRTRAPAHHAKAAHTRATNTHPKNKEVSRHPIRMPRDFTLVAGTGAVGSPVGDTPPKS